MTQLDLRALLLDLVRPLRPGARLASGATLVGLSTELGLRLRFDVEGSAIDVELTPWREGMRFAARTGSIAFGYRTEGGRHTVDPQRGKRLCEEVAALVRGNEGTSTPSASDAPRVREVSVQRLLERAPSGDFVTLSPYVGCVIGCRFCYAQSRLAAMRAWAGLPEVPWGSYLDVRIDAPEVLARELDAMPPQTIKLCPIVSDPYQAIEARYELTGRCLDVIADRPGWRVLVSTRSKLVLRDVARLARLDAHVGVSLPTVDDDVRRHFEPRAATIEERLLILRTLRAAEIRTFAIVQPMLPGPLDDLASVLEEHVDSVTLDVLRGVEGAAEDFADPRYAHAVSAAWQEERLRMLRERLTVPIWDGELPP